MTRDQVGFLLRLMPTVARRATNPSARRFARDMCRLRRREKWRPSPKQTEIMRLLVQDLFTHDPDFEVLDSGDA